MRWGPRVHITMGWEAREIDLPYPCHHLSRACSIVCYGACELLAGLRTVTQRGMEGKHGKHGKHWASGQTSRPAPKQARAKSPRGAKGRKKIGDLVLGGKHPSTLCLQGERPTNKRESANSQGVGKEGRWFGWRFLERGPGFALSGVLWVQGQDGMAGTVQQPFSQFFSTIIPATVGSPGSSSSFELWNYAPVQC